MLLVKVQLFTFDMRALHRDHVTLFELLSGVIEVYHATCNHVTLHDWLFEIHQAKYVSYIYNKTLGEASVIT